jgi:pyruvate dehydrogenase E2 component (dihydrolipoamide acetyltransferase)
MSVIDIKVPDIGDFKEVEVIELLVKPGDVIRAEQSLITVESDKASMEIPSSAAGTVVAISVKIGDKVAEGSLLLTLEAGAAAAPASPVVAPVVAPAVAPVVASISAPVPAAAPATVPTAPVTPIAAPAFVVPAVATAPETSGGLPHASPSVRKFARELGVNLALVSGTGIKARITVEDVRGYVKGAVAASLQGQSNGKAGGAGLGLLAWPKVDFAKFGEIQTKPLSRIKKISGANLHRNWVMIPHVTNHDDADITDLEAFRVQLNKENEKSGAKVTMLAFLIKACVQALKKFPDFNASLDGENLVLKHYFHIGFAADTPNGLVVPVIRDADKKGIFELAKEMSDLAAKARDGKLAPAEMQGGCFSISSLGGIGGTYFTPIINAPEVAILGVCRAATKPVWNGTAFEPRLILPMSLSWDHRVIDGASAARFNTYLASLLSDFRRAML